jgi:hypothetical protein
VTNADTDRAAVKGDTVQHKASTLSRDAVKSVLVEFATGDCSARFDALWKLVDKDNDGLMDAPEVSDVAYYSVTPVGMALKAFFDEVVEARPVRQPLDVDDENRKTLGLWARRRETSQKKRLQEVHGRCHRVSV